MNGRSQIIHDARVPIGRLSARVVVDAAGCVRFTTPSVPNFYSGDDWLMAERKQVRQMWRRTVAELIEARFP